MAEQIEAALARGDPVNISEHALLCSTMVRVARRIGIDRRAKAIIPDLEDYIEGKASISEDVVR
jgi:hypothetical protein